MLGGVAAWWTMSASSVPAATGTTQVPTTQQSANNPAPAVEPLPTNASFQTITTANGSSFEWPASWKVRKHSGATSSDKNLNYIDLLDSNGVQFADIKCPVIRVIDDNGYELNPSSRLSSKNKIVTKGGKSYSVRYYELESSEHAKINQAAESVYMEARPSDTSLSASEIMRDTCQLRADMITFSGATSYRYDPSVVNPIPTQYMDALRKVYDSWK